MVAEIPDAHQYRGVLMLGSQESGDRRQNTEDRNQNIKVRILSSVFCFLSPAFLNHAHIHSDSSSKRVPDDAGPASAEPARI
jgi:hypothetical protein